MRSRILTKCLALAGPIVSGGMLMGLSCSGVGNLLGQVNPCGTILACDPALYRLVAANIDGPGVRSDIDIFCTYPPFCPDDPILGPGGAQNP